MIREAKELWPLAIELAAALHACVQFSDSGPQYSIPEASQVNEGKGNWGDALKARCLHCYLVASTLCGLLQRVNCLDHCWNPSKSGGLQMHGNGNRCYLYVLPMNKANEQ